MDIDPARLRALQDEGSGVGFLTRGIEKESLRVLPDGVLSRAPHPRALGSPLTHPSITTDFSEAQLELITGVHDSAAACIAQLTEVHRFVHAHIGDELLWPSSMPCIVGEDDEIPIGAYGTSNIGMAKTVYRRGLGVRYGRLMQTISGIHYNFSVPESAWAALGVHDQDGRTEAYFGLIRNFRRFSWLLIYLFGASPAVCRSFTRNLAHNLQPIDEGSQHLPYATSLRMGPLGYQSSAQSALHISYNSLDEYTTSMVAALTESHPEYEAAGIKDGDDYQQLNTNILQIENEFYGTIRPKRPIQPGERPVSALRRRGVEYVEVRCLDLNPFLPVGIDVAQINFLDTFLMLCLLADSPPDSQAESVAMAANQVAVVERGREPGLTLHRTDEPTDNIAMVDWASELLDACTPIAALLSHANTAAGGDDHMASLATQKGRVADPEQTPSARVLANMRDASIPFFRFSMDRALEHGAHFAALPLSEATHGEYVRTATESLQHQADIEAADVEEFAAFLDDYLALPED